jgi:hypothetical protein
MSSTSQNIPQPQQIHGSYFPKDLAEVVYSELTKRKAGCPGLEVLLELFESMYFASLKTEESEPVTFHLVYLDPENHDPKPPSVTVHDRWSCVRLREPVRLRGPSFLKIAAASDPRTSSFAVYQDKEGRLVAWGLIDQGNRYHDYVNFDSDTGPERPGVFQASITGIGHLVAYIAYEKVAELKFGELVRAELDVLQDGPVRQALELGIRSHIEALRPRMPDAFKNDPDWDWDKPLVQDWVSTIRRLLLRVQNIRHGGAFLIVPSESVKDLSVKHGIKYTRLRSALERDALAQAQRFEAFTEIDSEFLDKGVDDLPMWLYLDESVANSDLEEIRNELDGAIWFVSLLTRVDGLVLLSSWLEVNGFGVEITTSEEPSEIFVAGDTAGTEWLLRKVDYQLYGTRHRSMVRYCAKFPGSVGFVISQDGDVRAMTKIGERLVVWENLRLQLPEFVRPKRRRRVRRRRVRAGGPTQ